ncbi:hypothetical protein [Halobacterium yunchengense]|uniref:hypothetical protein n=1 Tax=Halobacterium yunchengense TaxID=3108497 RepID=UPI003008FF84
MLESVAAAAVVAASRGVDVNVSLGQGLAGGAVGAFVTTLVVGAVLLAVFPAYTQRRMADVLDDPVGSFVYGLFSVVLLVVASLVLAVTIVGVLFAVPLLVVAYVLWAVGSAVAFLAVADRLVGHDEPDAGAGGASAADREPGALGGWVKPLVVAAALNGLLAVSGLGALLALCVGAAGFGAVLRARFGA